MRIAIVVPRYGAEIGGGAETQARGFAEEAVRRGWTVEVWTTCVRNHYTWQNELPAGRTEVNGVPVIRFPITSWDNPTHARLASELTTRGKLALADQHRWLESGPHSFPLYAHVAQHAAEFDACVMLPYTTQLTHYAAWMAPERTVVWPCLHAEAYASLQLVHVLLESVWGVMFNTAEEAHLAMQLLGMRPQRHSVLGEGLIALAPTVPPKQTNDLLYVGRLEGGKNVVLLYKYVQRYVKSGNNLRLVVIGSGPLQPPKEPAFLFRGFVDDQAKMNAYATALAHCQPSLNESFSLSIMESWLTGRPVLVNDNCAVTRGHVQRSKGGLAFRTYEEFAAAVDWLKGHPDLATRMGRHGQSYVTQNYTWQAVADRFAAIVKQWKEEVMSNK
ncbi:MAG: glycosyltransferase family 4 protein [Caldilineaceae bacterium]